jgi:hypothetical protein
MPTPLNDTQTSKIADKNTVLTESLSTIRNNDTVGSAPISEKPVDLRVLFHAIGAQTQPQRSLTASPAERLDPEIPVELLDEQRCEVTASPLNPLGFIDGIQAALTVTWREHRPVYLTFVAAGCVAGNSKGRAELIDVRERLDLVASHEDAEWLSELPDHASLVLLDATTPDEVERAALARLGADRDLMERELVTSLLSASTGVIVLDGSLAKRPVDERLVGVVKTTRTKWLPDETVLWGMPEGWRSPRFKIPAGTHGVARDRYSCYLRLFNAKNRAWDHGLIRLEAYDADILDSLAALAMADRQSTRSRDKRGDRHLGSVRACENVLRARRPVVFNQ